MGATFNRLKTWISETLTATDTNAEFNNILNNLTPAGVDDYSANATEMKIQTSPGAVGYESLATSLAGELARLRYSIARITGETYWYTAPDNTIANLAELTANSGLQATRLVSGVTTAKSQQSYLLTPEVSGNNVTIKGSETNLVYFVDGVQYTLASDVVITSTTAPPTSNNTASLYATGITDATWSKWIGIGYNGMSVSSVGTEIQTRAGRLLAFKLNNGGAQEYMLGRFYDAGTDSGIIYDIKRGWFWNATVPIPSIVYSNSDTITLMNIAYIYLTTGGTAITVYSDPVYSATTPTSPTSGDMWYDIVNQTWKTYNGSSYAAANCVYVGMAIVDESGNCVATRSEDFGHQYVDTNNIRFGNDFDNTANVIKSNTNASLGVFGNLINFGTTPITWSCPTNLDTGVSETNNTMYFFYIKETGEPVLSDIAPQEFTSRGGWYHPYETWRCVAQAFNYVTTLANFVSYHPEEQKSSMRYTVAANAMTLQYFAAPMKDMKPMRYVPSATTTGNTNKDSKYTFPFYQDITIPVTATLDHSDGIPDNVVLHVVYGSLHGFNVSLGVSSHQWDQSGLITVSSAYINDIGTLSRESILFTNYRVALTPTASTAMCRAVGYLQCTNTTAGTWTNANNHYFYCGDNINVVRRKVTATTSNFSSAAGAKANVTNISTFAKTGRAVRIFLMPDGDGTNPSYLGVAKSATTAATCDFYLQDTNAAGTPTVTELFRVAGTGASGTIGAYCPVGSLSYTHPVNSAANLPLYLVIKTADGSTTGYVYYSKLVVEELPHGMSNGTNAF